MNNKRSISMLILLIFVGMVVGSVLGDILKKYFEILGQGKFVGFNPVTIDLLAIKFTIGLQLKLGLASILGAIAGIIVFFKV